MSSHLLFLTRAKRRSQSPPPARDCKLGEWRACVGEGNCHRPSLSEEPRTHKFCSQGWLPKLLVSPSFTRKKNYSPLPHPQGTSQSKLPWVPSLGKDGTYENKGQSSLSWCLWQMPLWPQGRETKGLSSTLTHAGSSWEPAGCYYHWWHSAFSFPFSRAASAASFPVRQRWSRVDKGSHAPLHGKGCGKNDCFCSHQPLPERDL